VQTTGFYTGAYILGGYIRGSFEVFNGSFVFGKGEISAGS